VDILVDLVWVGGNPAFQFRGSRVVIGVPALNDLVIPHFVQVGFITEPVHTDFISSTVISIANLHQDQIRKERDIATQLFELEDSMKILAGKGIHIRAKVGGHLQQSEPKTPKRKAQYRLIDQSCIVGEQKRSFEECLWIASLSFQFQVERTCTTNILE
jgi:hypothetical protein